MQRISFCILCAILSCGLFAEELPAPIPAPATNAPSALPSPAATPLPSPASATPPPPASPIPAWTAFNGIKEPECVFFDPPSGSVFVLNLVGRADKKAGLGWISKLSIDGKVVTEKWVQGLNAPRGMRSLGNTLWVSDVDELLQISIADASVKRIKIEGAQFLNDVATHPDGTVYITDTAANKIFAYKNGSVSVFAEGEMLENPNGLIVDAAGGRLVVAAWGSVSQKRPGNLFQLDLKTKEKKILTPAPLGNLNGLELDGRGGYIVSDSISGTVFHVFADGKSENLMKFANGCGDLFYHPDSGILIVPVMTEGVVSAFLYKP